MTSGTTYLSTLFESRKNKLSSFEGQTNKSLIKNPISPHCRVCVVIPVRDEAANLVKTLDSLARQVDLTGCLLATQSFEIIVLANNCRDNSAEIAYKWQLQNISCSLHIVEIILPDENANVGYARRLLMDEAHRRLKTNKYRGGILMTTDGDSQVAPDWIAATIDEIENGADAVGGRIEIHPAELEKLDEPTRFFYLLDEKYRLLAVEFESRLDSLEHDTYPRHHQHFNGSFAVTTDAYERAGGVPDVKFLEDVAFYNALLRIDAKVRHSPQMRIYTSARNAGRTELGLSTQLNEWQIMGQNKDVYFVESAESLEKRYTARRNLRLIHQDLQAKKLLSYAEISAIAKTLCVSADWLFEEIKNCRTCGNLFERIADAQAANGKWKAQNPLVAVESAIVTLENKLETLRIQNKTLNNAA